MTLLRALAIAGFTALVLSGCGKSNSAGSGPGGPGGPGGAMPPPEVGVITAQATSVPLQQQLVGRLAPFRSADVRARVPGVLQRRVYEEGSDVAQGQVLFLIDPSQLQAALGQSEAAQAQAQATYANAKSAADRARQLLPQKYISQSDYDNAIAAERSAGASVQQAKSGVETARLNRGYATVRSPISGRAGKQQVTEGALVGQSDATLLTTVDQVDPLYVNFSMSVAQMEQTRRGAAGGTSEVTLLLPDGTPYEHAGALDFSGDVVDPATGAVALRARIPNPDKRLLPGTFVTVQATLGEAANAFLIPQVAVQRDEQGAYVMVVGADGKVARKDVTTSGQQGSNWVVSGGVVPGDKVIVSGLQRVQPGQPAKAVPAQATGPKPAPAPANPARG
ncbi:MAG: GntR family transcriptional regulator [Xanthomonadaceae bacterium]|nr:GntR family transcriptional regulator [Xanthomonadaceae bacterium]